MKKLLFIFCFCLQAITMFAQTVSYNHKSLSTTGGRFEFTAYTIDSAKYIVVRVTSEGLTLINNLQLLMKTPTGEVVKLNGETQLATSKSSGAVLVGNVAVSSSEIKSTAMFKITDEQIEKLKDGVMKVRLTTAPAVHEKEFRRDKIGYPLYEAFKEQENDNF